MISCFIDRGLSPVDLPPTRVTVMELVRTGWQQDSDSDTEMGVRKETDTDFAEHDHIYSDARDEYTLED